MPRSQTKTKRWLSRERLLDKVPLSYPTIIKLMADEERPFPAPRMVGSRPLWDDDEVDTYIASLPARPRGGGAA
jgi:predicted DNA-binding transcriptional regulator AlpA